jgi:hypothetical protein
VCWSRKPPVPEVIRERSSVLPQLGQTSWSIAWSPTTCINFANAAPRILRGSKQDRLTGAKVTASAVDGVTVGSRIIGTPLATGRSPPRRTELVFLFLIEIPLNQKVIVSRHPSITSRPSEL